MKYRLAVGSVYSSWTDGGNQLGADGAIQSYFRQQSPAPALGEPEYFSYEGLGARAIAAGQHTVDAGHTMKMFGPCTALSAADDNEKTVAFRIKVYKDETEYFSAASVTVRADKPQQEEQQLDFDAGDITDLIECALDQTDFDGQACNTPNAIPSTYNARLTVGVDESEATSEGRVFSHIYDEPTIKKGVDDKCGLFGALAVGDSDHEGNTVTEAVQACGLVTDIGDDGKNYIAQTASDSSVALVGPKNSYFNVAQANRVVTLRLLPLAGKNQIIGWTISCVRIPQEVHRVLAACARCSTLPTRSAPTARCPNPRRLACFQPCATPTASPRSPPRSRSR